LAYQHPHVTTSTQRKNRELGQEEMSEPQKQEVLEELLAFAGQVAADVTRQKSEQMQSASGVWKPGMS